MKVSCRTTQSQSPPPQVTLALCSGRHRHICPLAQGQLYRKVGTATGTDQVFPFWDPTGTSTCPSREHLLATVPSWEDSALGQPLGERPDPQRVGDVLGGYFLPPTPAATHTHRGPFPPRSQSAPAPFWSECLFSQPPPESLNILQWKRSRSRGKHGLPTLALL